MLLVRQIIGFCCEITKKKCVVLLLFSLLDLLLLIDLRQEVADLTNLSYQESQL